MKTVITEAMVAVMIARALEMQEPWEPGSQPIFLWQPILILEANFWLGQQSTCIQIYLYSQIMTMDLQI